MSAEIAKDKLHEAISVAAAIPTHEVEQVRQVIAEAIACYPESAALSIADLIFDLVINENLSDAHEMIDLAFANGGN